MFPYKIVSFSRLMLFTFLLFSMSVEAQDKNEEALAKTANELFQAKEFKKAKDVYSQLISLYPKKENYNYRFGACLLIVDKDKEFPIKFLEYAVTQPNVNVEAFYYMGKGYHYNLRFDEAIKYYQQYQSKVSPKEKNPLPAKDEIRYCNNGKQLLKDIKEPSILGKFTVNQSDFYVSIKIKPMGGRVLNAPKDLQSSYDKKQGYTPVMYVNTKTDEVYFSSYGSNGSTGLDIYKARVKSDGNLDKPIKLSSQINTPYDDSYPFMNEAETEFYFASKGHNSMGGYDIFKSDYNLDAETFASPINLDYSINTPDNDFMYATVTKEGYAFFVSDRNSDFGKVKVYKIDAEINSVKISVLTGVFTSKATKSCKITVTDVDRNEQVGTYSTNKSTGNYTMRLHQGGNYSFLVEPFGGQIAYKGNVKIPVNADKNLQQEIEIVEDNGTERLIIRNLFGDQPVAAVKETTEVVEDVVVEVAHNEEIDQEIVKTKKDIQEYIGENKKNANLSYTVANQKRELAQQDLAMAEQLESSISLNDESAENKAKQQELNQLMQDAQKHANEAEAAFELGTNLDGLVADAEEKLNKYEQYRVQIVAAEELDEGEKMQKVYADFKNDDDLFEEQPIGEFLATEIEKEERQANSYIAKAEKVGEKQITINSEISKAKVRKNSTKDPDEKETIQIEINELETDLEPLEGEKERLYKKASEHSAEAQKLQVQLETLNAYNELGLDNDQVIAEVSPDQKRALIASITATTKEIEALVDVSSDEMKIDGPKGTSQELASTEDETPSNSDNAEESSTEIITGGLPDDISNPENSENSTVNNDANESESPQNGEESTFGSSESPSTTNTSSDSKYFAYTDEYEEAVDEVALVEGESIPLVITSATGKREYTPEELAKEPVKLSPSPYQEAYELNAKQVQSIQNRSEKSKKLQYLNYNMVVDIEKEIAVLSYAKSKSTNEEYTNMLESKIEELEAQANQKRNFLALNSQIVKQLEAQEQEAVTQGEELAQTTENNEKEDAAVGSTATKTELGAEEAINVVGKEEGSNSSEQPIGSSSSTEPTTSETVTNVNTGSGNESETATNTENQQEEEESTFGSSNSKTTNEYVPEELPTIKQAEVAPGKAIVEQINLDVENQETRVEQEKSSLTELQTQLNSTKKKKHKRAIQSQIDQQTAELKLEKEKLKLIEAKKSSISNTIDVVVKNPLNTRPSVEKYVEAQSKRTAYKKAETHKEDLEDELSNTRKKKKKRAIQAEIDAVENEVQYKKMQYDLALETAKETEEVEVLALKNLTQYGSKVLVVLPETEVKLTPEEKQQVENSATYKEYQADVTYFESRLESASVMYQSASLKEEAVKELDAKIARLNREVVDLPEADQPAVLAQIEEAKQERKRLVREAEVFYAEAKSTTNEAYYEMNESNARFLKDTKADERTKIIAYIQGNFKEGTPIEKQEEILDFAETPAAPSPKAAPTVRNGDINAIPKKLETDIFESSNQTYYTDSNPIPVNVELPEGVVLKVQVGAFRNKISPGVFKGFAPIVAEKTGSGLTRYTAGLFTDFESANRAKTSIRAKGYSDAFVVAYLNGNRITIADARRLLGGEITASEVGSSPSASSQSSNPVTQAAPVNDVVINNVRVVETKSSSSTGGRVAVATVSERGDLYFTVQIGVYNQSVNPSSVFKITPLNSDAIAGGLVRYSSGIYPSVAQAVNARNRIVQLGIRDAFVTAYYNGNRITVAEAKRLATQNGGETVTNTPQPQQPQSQPQSTNTNTNRNEPSVTPNNSSIRKPVVKSVPKGNYYVEIGPYAETIPIAEARIILGLGSLGVIVVKKNGTTIYKIGNFTSELDANALRNDLKAKGLTAPEVKKSE